MKAIDSLRRSFHSCFTGSSSTDSPDPSPAPAADATKGRPSSASGAVTTITSRLSNSLADLFARDRQETQQLDEDCDAIFDVAAGFDRRAPTHHLPSPCMRSVVIGTIFGHRRGRVSFCVQQDPAVPPRLLFELSIPTQRLSNEMSSGVVRISLECHRCSQDRRYRHRHHPYTGSAPFCGQRPDDSWKAYCNGHKMGYAVRRQPGVKDCAILEMLRAVSAGAGVLPAGDLAVGLDKVAAEKDEGLGEVMYMRATYERVVGSRDSVSYHLINPGGGSPPQELSVFLLRTR